MKMEGTLNDQLRDIGWLENDWDSYGSAPINGDVIKRCHSISFSPMSNGGILIELFDDTHSVSISIGEDSQIANVEFGRQ